MSAEAKASLGRAIRRARELTRMSQEELGARVGKTQKDISRLENGQANWPEPELFRGIARELGVDESDLLRESGYLPELSEPEPELPAARVFTMAAEALEQLPPEEREAASSALQFAWSIWRRRHQRPSS